MLSGQGHALSDLLAAAGLPRSTYYRARSHPPRPTRPELRGKVAEVFSRTANGCGHRQIAMALRAEEGAVVADKTVLKIMREMGIRCGIRRESDHHRYNSFKGLVGRTFENVLDGTVKNLAHFSDSLISPPSGAATPPAESRPDSASSPTRSRPRT